MSETRSMLQAGDGSEFDKSLAALERMHHCFLLANNYSFGDSWDSIQDWLRSLQMLDRELHASYNDNDKQRLEGVRVKQITKKNNLMSNYRRKLDTYERTLREIHTEKGFNIKAKMDAGNVSRNATRVVR